MGVPWLCDKDRGRGVGVKVVFAHYATHQCLIRTARIPHGLVSADTRMRGPRRIILPHTKDDSGSSIWLGLLTFL